MEDLAGNFMAVNLYFLSVIVHMRNKAGCTYERPPFLVDRD